MVSLRLFSQIKLAVIGIGVERQNLLGYRIERTSAIGGHVVIGDWSTNQNDVSIIRAGRICLRGWIKKLPRIEIEVPRAARPAQVLRCSREQAAKITLLLRY